jgi:voltage-gated potassium channel
MTNHAAEFKPTTPPSDAGTGGQRRQWLRRFTSVELLIAIVLLFVASPFLGDLPGGASVEAALLTVVLLSAVLAIGEEVRTLRVAALLVAPVVVARWLHHFRPDLLPPTVYLGTGLIFIGFVVSLLLRFVLRASLVNIEVLCAGIVVFLMLGMVWAFADSIVAGFNPGAFSFASDGAPTTMAGFTAFYFSFMTLSGAGCGDITPISGTARMLTAFESMTGLFYVAVLVARLVSLYCIPNAPADQSDKR